MQKFKVTPDGQEPFSVTAGSRDISKWERITKGASYGQLAENMRMADLEVIAWVAAQRQGLYDGTLADFRANVEIATVDRPAVDDEDDDEDPTQPAA